MKNIGVITSGGDCGGLNGVVKGVAQMANASGMSCFVVPNGYAGLYNLVEFDQLVELTPKRAEEINISLAGSEAGHSRVKISKIADDKKYDRIKQGLKKFKIEGLVISGGDDSGSVMVDLTVQGIPCVHAPKTMDLDLQTYSVGGDSTVSRIAQYAQEIKTTGRTHSRIIVMEVFGRYAGHTAFRGGIAAEADAILIPEVPVDFNVLYDHMKKRFFERVDNRDIKSGTYLIVVAEGLKDASGKELVDESAAADAFGHKRLAGAAKYVCQELTKKAKEDPAIVEFMKRAKMYVKGVYEMPEIRPVTPGHLVRSGFSSAYDANFGKEVGAAAVLLLKSGISGVTVAGVKGKKVLYVDTKEAIKQRFVDVDQIAFHESLGICFGRKTTGYSPVFEKIGVPVDRHL